MWERIAPEAQAYIRALDARVGALEQTVQRVQAASQLLEATVHQVREQWQQNARTSSRPPSSDPPQALGQRPRREPRGRRPGGQPGHEGQTRARRPVAEVDVVLPVTLERWLDAGHTCGVPNPAGTCRELLTRRQAVWTFVRHPGVEPTNHAAERAIRPVVLWRKGRVGTHSPDGSRCVEALMTVVAPLKPPTDRSSMI